LPNAQHRKSTSNQPPHCASLSSLAQQTSWLSSSAKQADVVFDCCCCCLRSLSLVARLLAACLLVDQGKAMRMFSYKTLFIYLFACFNGEIFKNINWKQVCWSALLEMVACLPACLLVGGIEMKERKKN